MIIIVLVHMFFFFKQKTAYEMRISDWSSDVCSSDLDHRPAPPPRLLDGLVARAVHDGPAFHPRGALRRRRANNGPARWRQRARARRSMGCWNVFPASGANSLGRSLSGAGWLSGVAAGCR